MNVAEIKKRLLEMGAAPKKSLGQNFLVSERCIQQIVKSAASYDADLMIEVGPGLGSLTDDLMKLGKKFLVIELDRAFADYWRNRGLEVIEGDALRIKWDTLLSEAPEGRKLLVSNLPYQISSSIVIDRSIDAKPLDVMILMFQKEVAQKIASKNGDDYGLLTVIAQSFWQTELLLEAAPQEFYPAPQIASRVLVFKARPYPSGLQESDAVWTEKTKKTYLNFVKQGFAQRRKFLVSNLSGFYSTKEEAHERLGKALEQLGFDAKVRGETLKPEQWVRLFVSLGLDRK